MVRGIIITKNKLSAAAKVIGIVALGLGFFKVEVLPEMETTPVQEGENPTDISDEVTICLENNCFRYHQQVLVDGLEMCLKVGVNQLIISTFSSSDSFL